VEPCRARDLAAVRSVSQLTAIPMPPSIPRTRGTGIADRARWPARVNGAPSQAAHVAVAPCRGGSESRRRLVPCEPPLPQSPTPRRDDRACDRPSRPRPGIRAGRNRQAVPPVQAPARVDPDRFAVAPVRSPSGLRQRDPRPPAFGLLVGPTPRRRSAISTMLSSSPRSVRCRRSPDTPSAFAPDDVSPTR
jgi:hypothetical protein